MVEAEVEVVVVGHRLLAVEILVDAWHFEEVRQGLCMGRWSNLFPLGCRQ